MKLWLRLVLLVALVLSGCASRASEPRPPTIHYGEDVSAGCGMIISDARFATAALPSNEDPLLFDDIGDYLSYSQSHHLTPRAVFVHDFQTKDWLRADEAWYLLSPNIHTPMGSGLAAFAREATARQFQAKESGEVLNWTAVTSRTWSDDHAATRGHWV